MGTRCVLNAFYYTSTFRYSQQQHQISFFSFFFLFLTGFDLNMPLDAFDAIHLDFYRTTQVIILSLFFSFLSLSLFHVVAIILNVVVFFSFVRTWWSTDSRFC
jgi:hypothetical protein